MFLLNVKSVIIGWGPRFHPWYQVLFNEQGHNNNSRDRKYQGKELFNNEFHCALTFILLYNDFSNSEILQKNKILNAEDIRLSTFEKYTRVFGIKLRIELVN